MEIKLCLGKLGAETKGHRRRVGAEHWYRLLYREDWISILGHVGGELDALAPQLPVASYVGGGIVEHGGALAHDMADHPVHTVFVYRRIEIAVVGESHFYLLRTICRSRYATDPGACIGGMIG